MTTTQQENITLTLNWQKVHRDVDGGTEVAVAFKNDDEPLLFFIRRCCDMLDPKWREEWVVSYDGRPEMTCDGWSFRKVSDSNGAKALVFSFPCVIDSPYDCTGQICRDELFITLGANGMVVFMREYAYDV